MARRRGGAVVVVVVVAVVVVLVMTGCGSDEDGSAAADPTASRPPASSTAEPAPTEPAPTDPVVTDAAPLPTGSPSTPSQVATPATDDAGATTDAVVATAASPADRDLCAALDTVDLDGLLGEPAGRPELEEDDFGGGCAVPALDADSRGGVALRVTTNSAVENYENAREQFGVDAEIAGLGDGAFVSGAMVTVLSGDRLISLQAVRWRDLGIGGATHAELEAGVREVLTALGDGADGIEGGGTEGDGTGAGASVDGLACSLLADVDVEALIGETVGEPTVEEDDSDDVCVVPPSDPGSSAFVSLTIIDAEADRRFTESEEIFGVDAVVDGLGDEAFHSGPVLAVLDGERALILWIMGDVLLGADIADAELEAVMAQVLAAAGE